MANAITSPTSSNEGMLIPLLKAQSFLCSLQEQLVVVGTGVLPPWALPSHLPCRLLQHEFPPGPLNQLRGSRGMPRHYCQSDACL